MLVANATQAINIARHFLHEMGYVVYGSEIKSVKSQGDYWHVSAKFSYWFETKTADLWIDSSTGELKNYSINP